MTLNTHILYLHEQSLRTLFGSQLNQMYRAASIILETVERRDLPEPEAYDMVRAHLADETNPETRDIYLGGIYLGACELACEGLVYETRRMRNHTVRIAQHI